jgi:hypothetical protein
MDHSSGPSFNFVNLTHPDQLKDEETQHRIRRLAMTEVAKGRRKPKTRRGRTEILLEFRDTRANQHPPSGFDRLDGGEVDPFTQYPIDLDAPSRALVANSKLHFRTVILQSLFCYTYFIQSLATIVRCSYQKSTFLRNASAKPLDRHSLILCRVMTRDGYPLVFYIHTDF